MYLTLDDGNVCVDLKSRKSNPMPHGFFKENSKTIAFLDLEPINYCKDLQKYIDLGTNDYIR